METERLERERMRLDRERKEHERLAREREEQRRMEMLRYFPQFLLMISRNNYNHFWYHKTDGSDLIGQQLFVLMAPTRHLSSWCQVFPRKLTNEEMRKPKIIIHNATPE